MNNYDGGFMSKQMLIALLTLACIGAIVWFYQKKQADKIYEQSLQTDAHTMQYLDETNKKFRLNQ